MGVGAGGHATCVVAAIRRADVDEVVAFVDADPALAGTEVAGVPVVGDESALASLLARGVTAAFVGVGGVGGVGDTGVRRRAHERLAAAGFTLATVVCPTAVVDPSARIGAGVQILARAVVNPGVALGDGTIVNDAAVVAHDCRIGAFVHVAPAAVLSGDVTVGDGAHVGTNATVLQGRTIGAGAIVGAGAVVLADVAAHTTVVGVPAHPVT